MRNRLLFSILAMLLFPLWAFSQQEQGYIRYLITHNWSKKMAAVDYISKQRREKINYMWGNRSEWKSFANYYFTPTQSKYEDSEELAEPNDEGYSWRRDPFFVRRNFEQQTEQDQLTLQGKTYVVEDSIWRQDWKILNDMKEIAGHVCMNAVWEDSLKLQTVMAWFALDIPVSGGPERFGGLPGLILEVDVNNGGMLITADKIEMKPLTTELNPPKKIKGKKVNEAAYRDVIAKFVAERKKEEEPPFWGMRY